MPACGNLPARPPLHGAASLPRARDARLPRRRQVRLVARVAIAIGGAKEAIRAAPTPWRLDARAGLAEAAGAGLIAASALVGRQRATGRGESQQALNSVPADGHGPCALGRPPDVLVWQLH